MAGVSSPAELRIQALTTENEELKQLVQLLLEQNDRRSNQHMEQTPFRPVHEPTRLDARGHFGSQSLLDSGSFGRQPLSSSPQLTTPPMTSPLGAGPSFLGQLPLSSSSRLDSTPHSPHTPRMFTPPPPLSPGALAVGPPPQAPRAQHMQQFPFPQFQPPPVARLSPAPQNSGMQGAGIISPNILGQEFSFRSGGSSPGRPHSRGYCFECAVPFHPHLPQDSLANSALSARSRQSGTSPDVPALNLSSSLVVPGNQPSAAGGSSYGSGSAPHLPGLPHLSTPHFSPSGATFHLAARPPYPASPQHVSVSFSGGQSSPSGNNSPHIPQQGYVPFAPNYSQSFSPSGFAYSPETCSQPPSGKIPPSSPGALTLEIVAPQSPAPYSTFPSSLQRSPTPLQPQGTKVPQTPSVPKTKAHGESGRQATSMTMRKAPKDSKQANMERVVGEIAFQLDRRILSAIFPDRVRLYGFTVRNIPEKIRQNGSEAQTGLTEDQRRSMMERYNALMTQLKPLGYDPNTHPQVTEQIVNFYGILRERPDMRGTEGGIYNNIEYLSNIVRTTVPAEKRADCLMLLSCLHKLSLGDGKPLFIW